MRGNKRAVCFVLAVLLALGCLGMAGCKEPEPQMYVVGDLVVQDLPGNWKMIADYRELAIPSITLEIDADTRFVASFYPQYWLVDSKIKADKKELEEGEKYEVLDTVELTNFMAKHIKLTKREDVKFRYIECYTFKCGDGVGSIAIQKTPNSQYDINGEQFQGLLNSAEKLSFEIGEDRDVSDK